MKRILTVASFMMLGAINAHAAGTTAGTTITNSATLTFNVGGVPQTAVPSNNATFIVDKKIDFIVENKDGAHISVTPGATDKITTWSITNEGNMDQNFTFTASQLTGGETVYGNADTQDSGALTLEYSLDGTTNWTPLTTFELVVDASLAIRIKTDIGLNRVDGDVMNVALQAVAVNGSGAAETKTTGTEDKDVMDIVFAEGPGASGDAKENGTFVAWGGYKVAAPNLSLTKLSCVLTDPVNLTTNPKRIPGATVLYVLDINNASTTNDATDVNLSDTLVNTLDISTLTNLKSDNGQASCTCTDGTAYSGGSAISNSGSGQEVKLTGLTITKATHNCVTFEVDIK